MVRVLSSVSVCFFVQPPTPPPMKRSLLPVMLSSLLLAASSLGVFAQDTIKIGVYSPFSGGSSPMGLSMRDGVRLAAEEINAAGGVLGKPIQLVERDDQAVNERGAQVVQELISSEKVVAILGPTNTGVAKASYRYPLAARIPLLINISAGAPVNEVFKENPDNYIFGFRANDFLQAEMIVTTAIDKLGLTPVALLADETSYGQGGREKMEAALARRNVTSVYTGKFKIKDTDMTPQLQQARAAGAQALLVYGIGPELAQIANGMTKIGYKVPMIGGWTISMSNFIDPAGANGDGAMTPLTFIQNAARTPRAQKFVADYQKKFNVTRIPVAVAAAQGYDSMHLLAQAIAQAGSTEGPKIKAALEDLQQPYAGVIATFTKPFSATNHDAIGKDQITMGTVMNGAVGVGQ